MNERPSQPRPCSPRSQRGAVLVVAMIFLITLTLLAVSSMNTTSLEEKMAANLQEASRAFNAAENGLTEALADIGVYDLSGTYSVPIANIADTDFTTEYSSQFLGVGNPPQSLNKEEGIFSVAGTEAVFFQIISVGNTPSGLSNTVIAGAYQIRKKL